MTNEEAINMLHGIRTDNLNLDDAYTKDKYEALGMAIKALEQEPCEDCVSRQEVLKQIHYWVIGRKYLSANAMYCLTKRIQDLPPIQPKAKVGRWILIYGNVKCSICGNVKDGRSVGKATHYCDFCGAKMEVDE